MNFYQSLGNLILGTRLRRMSEYYLSEINKVYQSELIEFDASWFPVFYLLAEKPALSIKELADHMEVSHSAASQLITQLRKKEMVQTRLSAEDARRQEVRLSAKGCSLLEQVLPIWRAISEAMMQLHDEEAQCVGMLENLTAIESAFARNPLSSRINNALKTCIPYEN